MPFECQFDRGGVDPGPIIQSIETGAKKKAAKPTSVPSPGSSNSQDSFPPPGSGGASLDGYGGYPGQYPPTPAGQQPDYNASPMQRPPSQSNAQSPHPGTIITWNFICHPLISFAYFPLLFLIINQTIN